MLTNIAPSLVFRTGKNAPLGVKGGQSGRVAVFNVTLGGSFEVIVTDSDHEDEQKLSDEGCYVMWGSNIFPNWTRARRYVAVNFYDLNDKMCLCIFFSSSAKIYIKWTEVF